MTTQTRLLTAEEFLALPDDGLRHELVRGELTTMPSPGEEHGLIAGELYGQLWQYVKAQHLGWVYAAETGFRIASNPDTVRAPDVAFVRRERLTTPRQRGYRAIAPDLVAEVVSPSDRPIDVEEKIQDWLAAGTRLVLVVRPAPRTVTVYRSPADVTVLTEADQIEGGDVVPGWVLPVAVLFSAYDEADS